MTRQIDAGLARKVVALLCAQGLPAELVLARAGLNATTFSNQSGTGRAT